MDKNFWGPSVWASIHFAAAGYKPEHRYSFKQFINSLPYLLPCEYCKAHLLNNLKIIPLTDEILNNRRTLLLWSYNLHDLVTKQLKKKPSPSYQVVEEWYTKNTGNFDAFGPPFWRMIHAFSAAYRPEPAITHAYIQFINSLPGILPCKVCSVNLNNCLNQIPLTQEMLSDGHNLFLFSYFVHDCINKQLGKKSPTFEKVKAEYFNANVCGSCG